MLMAKKPALHVLRYNTQRSLALQLRWPLKFIKKSKHHLQKVCRPPRLRSLGRGLIFSFFCIKTKEKKEKWSATFCLRNVIRCICPRSPAMPHPFGESGAEKNGSGAVRPKKQYILRMSLNYLYYFYDYRVEI